MARSLLYFNKISMMKLTEESKLMKKFLMIAALALVAPLANAGDKAAEAADQAAAEATQKADIAAVETAAGNAAEDAQTEAAEKTQEAEGAIEAAK